MKQHNWTRYTAGLALALLLLAATGAVVVQSTEPSAHLEDAAHVSGDYGSAILAVRTDTQAVLSGTTGDYTPLQTNATGALRVESATALTPGTAVGALAVVQTVTLSGQAVWVVTPSTTARTLMLMAKKKTGANTGVVWVGLSDVDSTNMQMIELAPGEYWEPNFKSPVDLNTVYIDAATSGDGVVGLYQP